MQALGDVGRDHELGLRIDTHRLLTLTQIKGLRALRVAQLVLEGLLAVQIRGRNDGATRRRDRRRLGGAGLRSTGTSLCTKPRSACLVADAPTAPAAVSSRP